MIITGSMAPELRWFDMNDGNERAYRFMGFSGVASLTIGIITICVGVITGILLIVSGTKLLQSRSRLLF